MFAAGTPDQLTLAFNQLAKFLTLKYFGEMSKYLGLTIAYNSTSHNFSVSQGQYARKILEEFNSMNIYTAPTPMCEGEKWDSDDTDLLSEDLHDQPLACFYI